MFRVGGPSRTETCLTATTWTAFRPPRDVIGDAPVGVLHDDLRNGCLAALKLSREACRDFALVMTWEASAAIFLDHVTTAQMAPRPPRLVRWMRKARMRTATRTSHLSCVGLTRTYSQTTKSRDVRIEYAHSHIADIT